MVRRWRYQTNTGCSMTNPSDQSSTLWPGNWPPSPGFAPCAILICNSSDSVRYKLVTPNLALATCLIALRMESPLGSFSYLLSSSPPSPVLLFAPRRFIAIARVVCASHEIDPKLIAPVAKRLYMLSAGSTSSIEIAGLVVLNRNRLRSVQAFSLWSLTSFEYFLNVANHFSLLNPAADESFAD